MFSYGLGMVSYGFYLFSYGFAMLSYGFICFPIVLLCFPTVGSFLILLGKLLGFRRPHPLRIPRISQINVTPSEFPEFPKLTSPPPDSPNSPDIKTNFRRTGGNIPAN